MRHLPIQVTICEKKPHYNSKYDVQHRAAHTEWQAIKGPQND